MNSLSGGEMSPLHESALFQPKKSSINGGARRSIKTVFTCKKCGCTDMEEQGGEEEVKIREEAVSADPGRSNENRSSSRMSSSGSVSSSPCTNVSDDDDNNEINVVDDEESEAVAVVQDRLQAAPSSMSICEQLESMVTRYAVHE